MLASALAAVAAGAQCATQFFGDAASFAASTTGQTTIGFNGLLPAGASYQGYSSLTIGSTTFSTPTTGSAVELLRANYYTDYPAYATDFIAPSDGTPREQNTLLITFSAPTHAVALNYGGLGWSGTAQITLSNGATYSTGTLPKAGATSFAGWVSTDPISSVRVDVSNDFWVVQSVIVASPASGTAGTNYSDIWWNPSESGWGVTIADHQSQMFAVVYAYRADRRPIWYSIPGGTLSADRRFFTGDVYRTRGPSYMNAVFDPAAVTITKVGTASFDFAPAGQAPGIAQLAYSIDGVNATKLIQRLAYGNAPAQWSSDWTDLWWNSSESGWGLALAQHGNNVFAVWYAYDTDGEPLWFSMPGGTFPTQLSFTGSLYRTTGPYMGLPAYDPSQVVVSNVGTATFSLSSSKTQDACQGVRAIFIATVGPPNSPHLMCRLPFGSVAPGPSGSPLSVQALALQPVTAGQFSSQPAVSVTGGQPPYSYTFDSLANGSPPFGMSVDLTTGALRGTPASVTAPTNYHFGICVADLASTQQCVQVSLMVNPAPVAGGGNCSTASCEYYSPPGDCRCNGSTNALCPTPPQSLPCIPGGGLCSTGYVCLTTTVAGSSSAQCVLPSALPNSCTLPP